MQLNLRKPNKEDTEIARPRTLSGIDSLYFHLEIPYEDYSIFYKNILLNHVLELDNNYTLLSHNYEKQFTYFSYSNEVLRGLCPQCALCKIGFKNLNQRDNRDFITVELSSIALNYLGYKEAYYSVIDLVHTLGLNVNKSKASRLDLNTYVIGHNFDYLQYSLFATKMRNNTEMGGYDTFSSTDRLKGFNLGSRGGKSVYMRIYNKLTELIEVNKDTSMVKANLISEKYKSKYNEELDMRHLWQVEFELRRDILRRYGIDTVEDVFKKADSVHKDITTNQIRLIDPLHQKRKRDCRSSKVWSIISNNYSVFKDNAVSLSPEKCKVYSKTDEQKMVEAMSEYLERRAELSKPVSDEILYHIKQLKRHLLD